jgi:hypothetical protein
LRERRQRDIEAEHDYFEKQAKYNRDYNLQKYRQDKQRLRELHKTASLVESESIVEKIGESSSMGKRVSIMSKIAVKHQGNQRASSMTNKAIKTQNFFPN